MKVPSFEEVYKKGIWGKGKGSGTGSSPKYCAKYMEYVQGLIDSRRYDIAIDFGCGDWQFSQHMNWDHISYLGIDIVGSVVDEARERSKHEFTILVLDFSDPEVVRNTLKMYSNYSILMLVKDVFQHWEDHEIREFLDTIDDLRPRGTLLTANNWRYIRKPREIPNPRVLDQWRWCPIDFEEQRWKNYGLTKVLYYPRMEKVVYRKDYDIG
jgi:hypothetical protein